MGEAERGFEPQRVRMLIPAEFAPGGMEFAGHAEEFHAERLGVPCRQREMVIPPASGRKRLQLQMAVDLYQIAASPLLMAVVVIDRQAGLHGINRLPHTAGIIQVGLLAEGDDGCFVAGSRPAARRAATQYWQRHLRTPTMSRKIPSASYRETAS